MQPPIRLIINADDLGAGTPTDQGILEAFAKGVVSSASLLVNGPSFVSAVALARDAGLPIGVHLNLSEGEPLSGPIPGLTDTDGRFPGKQVSRRRFQHGEFDPESLARELFAQIERVRQAGLQPDHLDTHQHCGLFPPVTQALIAAANQSGIRRMRLPAPATMIDPNLPPALDDELQLYRQLAPQMAQQLREAGITTPDGLLGMPLLNRLDEDRLSRLLTELPAGTWELMVHPGYIDPHRAFSGVEREQELHTLVSPAIRSLLSQRRIRLISFAELSCAC